MSIRRIANDPESKLISQSYHIFGLVVVLHAQLFAGVSLIVLPKFDLKLFLKYTAQYRVDIHCVSAAFHSKIKFANAYAGLVPPIAVLLVKSPEAAKADLSSMKDIKIGAAPLTKETMAALKARIPNCAIGQGYGMTETAVSPPLLDLAAVDVARQTSVVSSPSSLEIPDFPSGAIGRILPDVAAKIMDPQGKALAQGEVGELAIYSPSNALGYLNNQKATEVGLYAVRTYKS